MTLKIQKKITRNVLFTSMGQVSIILINFLLIPYIISKLGIERYGIWTLAYSVIGFIALLDFGVGDIYTKFVSELIAKNSIEELNITLSTGLVFTIFIGIIFSIPLFVRNDIISFFHFNPIYIKEAYFVLTWAIIIFIFIYIAGIFNGLLWGMQRLGVLNTIDIISALVNVLAIVIFLEMGLGLRGLIFSTILYSLFSVTVKAFLSYRLLPGLNINPLKFRYDYLKIMLNYGVKLQITKIASFVSMQLDKVFIGHFLNVALVSYYDIGATVARTTRRIPMLLLPAIIPAASELDSLGEKETLYKLFIKSSKYVSMITIPLCFFIIINATNIILLWMGPGYEKSAIVFCFLSVGFSINVLTGPGTSIVRGIGRPEIETRYTSILAVSNAVMSFLLVLKYGLYGAVVGTALSMSICSIYFFYVLYREVFQKPLWPFFKETIMDPFVISFILAILTFLFNALIYKYFNLHGRIDYIVLTSFNAALFFSIYLFWIFKKNFISALEVKKLYGYIRGK